MDKIIFLVDGWLIMAIIAIVMLSMTALSKKPLLIFVKSKDRRFIKYKARKNCLHI